MLSVYGPLQSSMQTHKVRGLQEFKLPISTKKKGCNLFLISIPSSAGNCQLLIHHSLNAEAVISLKSSSTHHRQFEGVVSLLPPRQKRVVNKSSFTVDLSSSQASIEFQRETHKSRRTRIVETAYEDQDVPTLTPLQLTHDKRSGEWKVAAIIGVVGAALFVVVIVALVFICLMRFKRFIRRTSASSIPSPSVERRRRESPPVGLLPQYDRDDLRQFTVMELEHATSKFSQSNIIIGEGGFGLVHRGLLQDGTIVAVKKRTYGLSENFAMEVKRIAHVGHKHLVKLIGYGENSHQQLLVYNYIPNGNVGKYLYDSEGMPVGKLDLRQRLFIALGAAEGLQHLHSMVPPLLHMHFRTSNVLLDENYVAKVSDFGLSRLLIESYRAGSSSAVDCFLDPELKSPEDYSEISDVYSFGIFLLEMVSVRDSCSTNPFYNQNIVERAKSSLGLEDFLDETLRYRTRVAAEHMFDLALLCIDTSSTRPSMTSIVEALEWIQEKEIGNLQHELGDEIGAVTLGSELFT